MAMNNSDEARHGGLVDPAASAATNIKQGPSQPGFEPTDAVPAIAPGFASEPSAPAAIVGDAGPHQDAAQTAVPSRAVAEHDNARDGDLPPVKDKTSKQSEGSGTDDTLEMDPYGHLGEKEKEIVAAQAAIPPVRKLSFLELFKYSSRLDLFLNGIGLFCAIAAGAAQPLMTLVFGNLTTSFASFQTARLQGQDTAGQQQALFSAVVTDAYYLIGIGAGMWIFVTLYSGIWTITGERTARTIRQEYLRAVLKQNIAYFDKLGGGEVATRIESDAHLIQEGISDKVPIAVQFVSTFVTGFIIAYIKSWQLALVLSSIIPALIVIGAIFNIFIASGKRQQLALAASGGTLVEEVFSTIRTTLSYGLQDRLAQIYDKNANIAMERIGLKMAKLQGASFSGFFFVVYNAYALAVYWGTTLLLGDHIVPGSVVTSLFAILFGAFSLVQIAPMLQSIGYATGAGAKIFDTLERVPPIDSSSDEGLKPESLHAEFTLENINFVYPSRPGVQVLYDFSATFRQGQTTALVGGSGSGKSTIIGLLERFYDAMSGTVKLDGIDVKDLNIKWLRTQIGYVSQEPTLFQNSIAENVAHGLIGTTYEHLPWEEKMKMVVSACQKANADEFVRLLPQGYETSIGERGMLLSGGQKQRICIARAIIADPPILLLDEATSALDSNSERVVQAALDVASKGRTTISIAHRLSTIRNAEQIICMQNGRILERGSYEELVSHVDGPFARLVNAQRFREDVEKQEKVEEAVDVEVLDEKQAAEDDERLAEKAATGELDRKESMAGSMTRAKSSASSFQLASKRQHDFDTANEESTAGMWRLIGRIIAYNKANWRYYVAALITSCVTGMIYPVFGIIFGSTIGIFSESGQALRDGGNLHALYLFILALVSTCSIGIQNYSWFASSELMGRQLRLRVYRDIMRQDVAYFDRDENSSGSLTSNVSDYAIKVNGLFGITAGTIVQSLITLLGGIIVGLSYAPKVAGVGIAVVPFTFSAGFIRLRVVMLKDKRNKASHAKSAQMACEAAAAIRTVASLRREQDVVRIYEEMLEAPYRTTFRTAIWSNIIYGFSQGTSFFGMALIFWYGSHQLVDAGLSSGHFFVALMSVLFGSIQAGNIFSFVPDFSGAVGAARAVVTLIDSKPEIVPGEGEVVDSTQGELKFKNVHFRYPTRPNVPVLRGLNLTIKPGSFVALVGPSGCGKSTTIQLIERFYDPIRGQMLLDGKDVSKLEVESMRSHFALVAQEPTLYDGTLKENVLWGSPTPDSVTQEQIEAACRDANILDFVRSLPDGFETSVGSKGAQLSGGQKQRLALARALIRQPRVLLLDEATSALDSESEKVVQRALDQAAKGRTTIAVAHRLTTIQHADLIVVLLGGKVHEHGKHAELMRKKGMYFELVSQQTLDR